MNEPKRMTLYEELWECRFRIRKETVAEPPKADAPGLAVGLDHLFGKIGTEVH